MISVSSATRKQERWLVVINIKQKYYTFKGFTSVLEHNGYALSRVKGDHYVYKKDNAKQIVVNIRPNKMVIRRLIKENNLLLK